MASEYKNIFDAARLSGKKPPKKEKGPIRNPQAEKEIDEMLEKIRGMNEDLKKQMDGICQQNKVTNRMILKNLEDPKHFSSDAFHQFQKAKAALIEKIKSPQTQGQKPTTRKSKTLGTRKKWIQM